MNLRKLRALSHVWRWNYHPRVRQESVAEHSYWTTVYAARLCHMMDLPLIDTRMVLQYALLHDAEEAITGDLPGPVKRGRVWKELISDVQDELDFHPLMEVYPEQIKRVVKAADLISALVFADEEVKMGNTYFLRIREEIAFSIKAMEFPEAHALMIELGVDFPGLPPYPEMSHL